MFVKGQSAGIGEQKGQKITTLLKVSLAWKTISVWQLRQRYCPWLSWSQLFWIVCFPNSQSHQPCGQLYVSYIIVLLHLMIYFCKCNPWTSELESVAISWRILGTNTVFSLLWEAIHARNTKKETTESKKKVTSYPAPSIMFLRLQ